MSYELHVLRAAADGVQPALLLRAVGKKAEYLFNVPDGFSRLAMEQKLTPSARLSCVLLTDLLPATTGGLAALLLRLRHDGHGQTQLIGPHGSASITHALRHVCRWRHPKVFVSECRENCPVPVFEDEHVVIVPLLAGDQSTGCPWCLYAAPEKPAAGPQEAAIPSELRDGGSGSDSLGSESSVSSDDEVSSGFVPSSSDGEGDSFAKSLSAFNACSEMGDGRVQSDEGFDTPGKLNSHKMNGASVDVHIQREGADVEKESPNVLPQQRKRDINESFSSGLVKVKKVKTAEHGVGKLGSGGSNSGSAPKISPGYDGEGSDLLKATTPEDVYPNVMGRKEPEGVFPASPYRTEVLRNSFVQSTKPYEWLISNSLHDDLPQPADESNPVYGRHPASQATVILGVGTVGDRKFNEAEGNDSCERNPARVLGYVSFLRKANTALVVVDCRDTKDLDSLRRHPALSCMYRHSDCNKGDETNMYSQVHIISTIVHLTAHNFVQSCDYQSWMCSMGSLLHVVMNEIFPEFGFKSSLAVTQRLNNIHQDIFPLPFHSESKKSGPTTHLLTGGLMNHNARVVDARLSMCLTICEKETTLSPTPVEESVPLGLEEKSSELEPEVLPPQTVRSNEEVSSYLSPNALAATAIKRRLLQQRETALPPRGSGSSPCGDDSCEDVDRGVKGEKERAVHVSVNDRTPMSLTAVQEYNPTSEFQLTFLGTGCAEPSKNRGSSSILLQVRGAQGAMLLDAGEGAAGQLFRRFGEHAAKAIISSLQCLWLSHKHGDHVLGVLSILQTRSSQAPPLLIIGPHKVHHWLTEVHDIYTSRGYSFPHFTFIHCNELSYLEPYKNQQLPGALDAMQLKSMFSVKVFHCHDAYGIVLSGRQGWKVVYSGDTRPCNQLIEAGQGCTVLIHEATFEDSLVEQAKGKRHSTVSEAVQVGWQMRARHVVLTHFSQRYPEMVTVDGDRNENLSVAFDGMVVPSQLLGALGKLLPQIRIACQKNVNVSPTTEIGDQRRAGISKPMPIRHGGSPVQQSSAKEPLVAKHKRWLSDSDDEATDQCASLRWSSDSDEEAVVVEQGSPLLRNGSNKRTVIEAFLKRNSCEGGCGTTSDSFKGMGGISNVQRVGLQKICQVERVSSNSWETAGPLGGKHIRWTDYDSEDG